MLLLRENSYPKDERICPIALDFKGRTDIRYVRSMSKLELDMVNYGGVKRGPCKF